MRAFSIPSVPVIVKSISKVLLILYALLLALGLGLGSAHLVLEGNPPFGGIRLGSWQAWPRLGSASADPYMRAITARRGDIPLAVGEGLTFSANADSEGRRLDSACSYALGSAVPTARLWTLTLYDDAGRLPSADLGRGSFTSSEIIRDADDRFTINLSRDVQPGNWLQLPSEGPFTVVLRLYDPPGAAGSGLEASAFPTIERLGCRA